MNIIQLYEDYNISYQTKGHKHCRPGWANVECPFCTGNPGLHLGVPVNGGFFHCWRCGDHPPSKVISILLGIHEKNARKLLLEYVGTSPKSKSPKVKIRRKSHKLPSNVEPLSQPHKRYLAYRGFDPDLLEKKYQLQSLRLHNYLDKVNYSRRILAPIFWDNKQVTFQARDVTGRHPLKYMACPKERELIHHKHIVYGRQTLWGNTGLCVEGITDVWRLGDVSFATFGIKYTSIQLRLIAKTFKRVAVIFDDESQAQIQANKLVADLLFRGVDAFNIEIEGDPGGMSQDDADHLVRQILKP